MKPCPIDWPSESIHKSFCDTVCATGQGCKPKIGMSRTCRMVKDMLHYQATHDPQTELPNLDLLIEHADEALESGKTCNLVILLVHGLTDIGQHHGVAAALHAIREVSSRIRGTIQDGGLAARIHGDLFAAVCYDDQDVEVVAERMWAELARPIAWEGQEFMLVVAAGAVSSDDSPGAAEGLIQAGYAAAKHSLEQHVRGGVSRFTRDLGSRIERQYQVELRLRSALVDDRLSLALQAKVSAADGRILGAEALLRWHDAQLGRVPPSEFIPLAERNRSIADLSDWVLRQGLAQAAAWQQAGLTLNVAVNLSAIDLHRPDLVADIQRALTASGCEPSRLIIELTESAVAEKPDQAVRQLQALKRLGIGLALDDFGTGYSALSYLRRFPIDALKIDRSFVTDTPHDADAVAIVRSIVALAQSLGMKTVAEGVETAAQAAFLSDIGVDVLQGYLFMRPVSPEQFMGIVMPQSVLPQSQDAIVALQ